MKNHVVVEYRPPHKWLDHIMMNMQSINYKQKQSFHTHVVVIGQNYVVLLGDKNIIEVLSM